MIQPYMFYLVFHLIGAIVLGIAIIMAFTTLLLPQKSRYGLQAIIIGFLGFVQFLSGSLLSMASPTVSPALFCAKIGLYALVIGIAEVALYLKMKNKEAFPKTPVYASMSAGILIACLTYLTF